MLEINIASLIFTGLVALGLIGAQAALTKKNFVLTVTASEKLVKEGYSREVIEALFFNEIEWIAHTRSMTSLTKIEPADEKGVVATMADLLHMGELSHSMQRALGKPPHRVWVNFVNDSDKTQALVFGDSMRGDFQRVVAVNGDTRLLVKAAAYAAIRAIDPYLMALHDFELGRNPTAVEEVAKEELARQRVRLTPLQQAAFHNLIGLVRLEKNDKEGALAAFDTAFAADPQFSIARVNRAFTLVALDRHPEAIATARAVLAPPTSGKIDQVVVAAHMIIALSAFVHGDHDGAGAEFAAALREVPNARAPLLYWARMLKFSGRQDESVEKLMAASGMTLEGEIDDVYAEIAMLYFRIAGRDKTLPVIRRVLQRPNLMDAANGQPGENPNAPVAGMRPPLQNQ